MYAIVESGGFQFRVEPGCEIDVPRMTAKVGEKVRLERVLFYGAEDGSSTIVKPTIDSAHVEAEVLSHGSGDKVLVQKFKRRKDYRRLLGQRARTTRLRVLSIEK